ncbi:MAG: hypothetical protein ACOY93_12005 [Bacillota bacterium]
MIYQPPPSVPPWAGAGFGGHAPGQAGQAVSGAPAFPMTGQQALYLLALMAQLAQAAHQGGQAPAQPPVPWTGQPAGAAPQGGAQEQQAQGGAQPQQGSAVAAVAPAQAVQPVAGVEFPDLPAGTRDRHYWLGGGLTVPGATNSLNPWVSGPIRSAWRR